MASGSAPARDESSYIYISKSVQKITLTLKRIEH